MKKYSVLFCLLILGVNLLAQNKLSKVQEKCKNIYVWDFLDQNKDKNRTTNDLTEAVEEALTNVDECFVLQRRNLATLVNQAAIEKGVNSVKEMRYEITHALSGKGARLVLFGNVDMSARDACEVRLRIEDLATSRIVTAKSTRILYSEIADIDNRNKVVKRLVYGMIGKLYSEPVVQRQTRPYVAAAVQQPKRSNFTLSAKSTLDLIVGDCIGDSYNQTVTVNFTFINNGPNLEFNFPEGISGPAFASDDEGNQYTYVAYSLGGQLEKGGRYNSAITKQFFTGTKLRASITFSGIVPTIKKLVVVRIPFTKVLSGQSRSFEEVAFRDLNIQWR